MSAQITYPSVPTAAPINHQNGNISTWENNQTTEEYPEAGHLQQPPLYRTISLNYESIDLNGGQTDISAEEQAIQDELDTQQLVLQQKSLRSPRAPVYNTRIRHGFAQDYESEQYMQMLAEVCVTFFFIVQ